MRSLVGIKEIFSAVMVFVSFGEGLEKTIQSRVSNVTVYTDRALVIRKGEVTLPEGEHRAILKNLPVSMDENSVRVIGTGFGKIQDIEFFHDHFEKTQDEKLKRLLDGKTRLEDSLAVYQDRISQSDSERKLVENIVKKLTAVPGKDAGSVELNPEKWIKMVSYYRTKLRETAAEKRLLEKLNVKTNDKIAKIMREITDLNRKNTKMAKGVIIKVLVKRQGIIGLKVSYIVNGVSWNPVYDIRVLSNKDQLALIYKGKIRQNTVEDWTNVKLSLSTASPSIDGTIPEFRPWNLYIAEIRPHSKIGKPMAKMQAFDMEERMEGLAAGNGRSKPARGAPALSRTRATVETHATSVLYEIPGKSSVAGNNREHTVQIAELLFPARLNYSAIPKLSPHVYLKAEATNTSPYSFLAGISNVFLDNHFVSRAHFDQVAPSEKIEASLGVDAEISVERKLIKKFKSKEGLIGRKNSLLFEYAVELESHKKNTIKLVLWDQLPVSNDERIQVALLKPGDVNKSKTISINDSRYIQWELDLKPNSKVSVPFAFSVSWPKGEKVSGL